MDPLFPAHNRNISAHHHWPCYLKECISPNWRASDTCVQFWSGTNDSIQHVESLTFKDFIAFSTEIANVLTEHARMWFDSCRSELLIGILWRPHILTTVAIHSVFIADLAFYPVLHSNSNRLWLLAENLVGVISLGFTDNDALLLPRGYIRYKSSCDHQKHQGVFNRNDWSLWLRKKELCYPMPDMSPLETGLHIQSPSSRLAYIITTSGSCGGPVKLVFVADSCLAANVYDLANRFPCTKQCLSGVLLTAPLTFDPSLVQIYFSLVNNQFLLIPEEGLLLRSSSWFRLVIEAGVSWIQCTPGLWLRQSVRHQNALMSKPQLTIVFGGEALPTQCVLDYLNRKTLCMTSVYNIYGISEVSSWATISRLKSRRGCLSTEQCECIAPMSGATPIGVPMFATEVDLLGDAVGSYGVHELAVMRQHGGHAVVQVKKENTLSRVEYNKTVESLKTPSLWATGDLVIRGTCGSCLWYVGRSDRLVKRFGHQICLDRLEQAISEYRPIIGTLRGCKCKLIDQSTGRSEKLIAQVAFIPRPIATSRCGKLQDQRLKMSIIGHLKRLFAPDVLPWLPTEILIRRQYLLTSPHGKMQSPIRHRPCSHKIPNFIRRMRLLLANTTASLHQQNMLSSELTFYQIGGTSLSLVMFIDSLLYEFPQLASLRDKLMSLLLYDSLASFIRFIRNLLLYKFPSNDQTDMTLRSDNTDAQPLENNSLSEASHTGAKSRALSDFKCMWKCPLGKCVDAEALPMVGAVDAPISTTQVVVGSHSGILAAINLETGTAHTLVDLKARIEASACQVSYPGGHTVAVGTLNGDLHVVEMEVGRTLASFDTGGAIKAAPTYLQRLGLLVCGSHGRLVHALDIRSSESLVWSVSLDQSPIVSRIALTENEGLLAATLGGSFGLIEPRMSGRSVWQRAITSPIFASPLVLSNCSSPKEAVLVIGVKGNLTTHCLNDGSLLWNCQIPDPVSVFNEPLLEGNGEILLVPLGTGYLAAVDAKTGHLQWSLDCCKVDSSTSTPRFSLSRPSILLSQSSDPQVVVTRSDGLILSFPCLSLASECEPDLVNIPKSTYRLPSESFSAPVVLPSNDGYHIVVGCRDDCLHCIATTLANNPQ